MRWAAAGAAQGQGLLRGTQVPSHTPVPRAPQLTHTRVQELLFPKLFLPASFHSYFSASRKPLRQRGNDCKLVSAPDQTGFCS